jgi:uncharacterized DUF497 family protein
MEIEFDPDKAAVNPLNHDGVTFDEAATRLRRDKKGVDVGWW